MGLQGKYVYHLDTDYSFLSDIDMYTVYGQYVILFEVKHYRTNWTAGNLVHQENLIARINGPAMIVKCKIPASAEVRYVDGCITGLKNDESTKNAIIKLEDTEIVDIEFNSFFTKEEIEKILRYKGVSTNALLRAINNNNFI